MLVADGVLDRNTVTMPAIRQHFQQNPRQLDDYIRQNERFVFFEEYPATDWPAGSLGFRVTPRRSLATDKKIFPRGGAVVVSQFTLFGDARKGRRPSFISAARPELAEGLCDRFATQLKSLGVVSVATGRFGADMQVAIHNDGPVTLWLDSAEW
ncbi:MAG: D-aminoacyl-tRNA deacylase [Planctomycetota bacterium]